VNVEAPARPWNGVKPTTAALVAGALLVLAVLYVVKVAGRMPDFEVYYRAGTRAADAEPLYRETDGHYQFKYLPAFALAVIPMAALPDPLSRVLWFVGSLALLAWLLRTSTEILPERRRTRAFLIGATFVLLAKFYAHEIELGQVNILMTSLVVAAAARMRAGREAAAGALIAAAIVVKPYAVLFLPYLLARRRLTTVWAAGGGLAAALILPAVVYGVRGNLALLYDWWRTVTDTTAPNLIDLNNVSAASVFTRALGPGPVADALALGLIAALLAAAAVVFVLRSRAAFPEGLEVALLLTMMPILSPQGWDYVFLMSTAATMFLVNYSDALPRAARVVVIAALIVIAFSIFDLIGRTAYQTFMRLSMITWCYLIVIGGLVVLRLRRIA
jgi:hypothetical protein